MEDKIKQTKENYLSWNVDIDDISNLKSIEDWAKYFLKFAILAPSSHNSQPWFFKVVNNIIEIYKDKNKILKIGDPDYKFMLISIGCALANIKVAADYYGFEMNVSYLPEVDTDLVAMVSLTGVPETSLQENKKEHLLHFIKNRSTNREKYLDKNIPESFFKEIEILQNEYFKDIFFDSFSNQKEKRYIGEISAKSATEIMNNPQFLKELSGHIKNNLTKAKHGIPAFGMSIPTPVSLFVPFIIKYINMDKLSEKSNIKLFEKFTPNIGIVSTLNDGPKDWILAGEFYELVALTAEKYGLKTSIWGAPVMLRSGALKIKDFLPKKTEPQIIFRIGYPKVFQPHSPRHLLNEVLLKN